MPIPIILAIFIALFTLGANVHRSSGHPAEVIILGGKEYNWADKKDNRDTLVLMAPEQDDHTIFIKSPWFAGYFENRVHSRFATSRFTSTRKYTNPYYIQQAVYMSVK